jgi:hypothetical protein
VDDDRPVVEEELLADRDRERDDQHASSGQASPNDMAPDPAPPDPSPDAPPNAARVRMREGARMRERGCSREER